MNSTIVRTRNSQEQEVLKSRHFQLTVELKRAGRMSSHKDHRMIEFTQGANRGTICGEVRSCRRLVSPSSFPPARDTRRDIRTIITGFKWNRDRSNLLPMYQRPPIDYEYLYPPRNLSKIIKHEAPTIYRYL